MLLKKMPCQIGDLKIKDANLENYPFGYIVATTYQSLPRLFFQFAAQLGVKGIEFGVWGLGRYLHVHGCNE